MKNTNKKLNDNRRDFIKKSALIGAGIAASTVASGQAVAAATTESVEIKTQKGYQLTDHVADYYKSAAS
ncbi:MAG: twin-arginine translocation signal domain-containing protein [Gammaproteobacteria bacterium]|nr:twin-arginine translocation signal domain-containing protein [Gammaproteobacteria bacterium]